jgi:AcrR family transcriptional regulator
MPKKPMSPEEVEAMKGRILQCALDLLAEKGFGGLSLREVARRMGVVIGTLYGYYKSKDDLYLAVLTRGFERLLERFLKVSATGAPPLSNLAVLARAYIDFGLEEPHFYNIMFTWHVPKFRDYENTPLEAAARLELETALKVYQLVLDEMNILLEPMGMADQDELQFWAIYFWATLHGYVAGLNNTLLNYMHENPNVLNERFLETLMESVTVGLAGLKAQKGPNRRI